MGAGKRKSLDVGGCENRVSTLCDSSCCSILPYWNSSNSGMAFVKTLTIGEPFQRQFPQ
jgi:hypothetical protein